MDHDMLDRELREVLARSIAEPRPAPPADDPIALVEQRVGRRRHRRRFVSAGALAGAVAIVAAVAIAVGQSGGGRHTDVQVAPVTTTPRAERHPLRRAVDQYPAWPLAVRGDSATVAIGDEIVVWGGDVEAFNMGLPGPDRIDTDGAAFSTTTRTWRELAPAPLPATTFTPVAVATRTGVVVARGRSVAQWNPDTDSWRALGEARAAVNDMSYTGVAGREVVSFSADQALDLGTGQWHDLPPAPDRLERVVAVWTGRELVVMGGSTTSFQGTSAVAFDPRAGTWRQLAAPPADLHSIALGADWDGRRVVVVNYDGVAYSYDPTSDRFSPLPPVPARFLEWTPTVRSSGGYTAVFMGEAIVVLTPDERWIPVPYGVVPRGFGVTSSPEAGTVSVNGMVYVWGVRDQADSLVAIDLGRVAAAHPRIQVGVVNVRVPSGYELSQTSYSAPAGASNAVVSVRFSGPGSRSCLVSSTYLAAAAPAGVPEMLTNDGAPRVWRHSADGTTWETGPSSADTIRVHCGEAATAKTLAESASFIPA